MKKKRKTRARTEADRVHPPEWWEERERVQRMLAERITHHEAPHRRRERGEDSDAAAAA
jgi:hypothetical protein